MKSLRFAQYGLADADALAVLLGVEPEDVGNVRAGMPATLKSAFDNNASCDSRSLCSRT
ncbi:MULTISPECIES: hypothetical protein [unclassified Nitrobacter]|uniref:hypothetical protein n=1 Tax=unclassified Nitrobacter TaxID=2620411 RepID=UPI000A6B1466|nr:MULTISPECIES: hypothetical protein [unclassified Nitrobacter]MBN9149679.1 hypothetical protein [Nitrobacter sp.]